MRGALASLLLWKQGRSRWSHWLASPWSRGSGAADKVAFQRSREWTFRGDAPRRVFSPINGKNKLTENFSDLERGAKGNTDESFSVRTHKYSGEQKLCVRTFCGGKSIDSRCFVCVRADRFCEQVHSVALTQLYSRGLGQSVKGGTPKKNDAS